MQTPSSSRQNMAVSFFVHLPHQTLISPSITHLPLLQVADFLLYEAQDFVEGIKGLLRPLIFQFHGGRRHSLQGNVSGDVLVSL